ncbi:MAG: SMC-Scp complex subunit ScpB [Phycisphaerae bacterium]
MSEGETIDRTGRESEASGEPSANRSSEGPVSTESIVEALLLATDSPLGAARISSIIGDVPPAQVKDCIASLNARYERTGASFRIEEIAKGYQILTLPEFNVWLRKLLRARSESKLSQAALETLAVVAYRQPVLRVTIEEIRGVQVGEMLQRLREMNLVKIVGRAEEIGRPLLYGTTKKFLEVFGLPSLAELPKVEELTPPDRQTKVKESREEESSSEEQEDGPATFARIAEAVSQDAGDSGAEAAEDGGEGVDG